MEQPKKPEILLSFQTGTTPRRIQKYYRLIGGPPAPWWGPVKMNDEKNYDMLRGITAVIVSNDAYGQKVLIQLRELKRRGYLDNQVPLLTLTA